jgi:hypothetical protein
VATDVGGDLDWSANHSAKFLQPNINQLQRVLVLAVLPANGFDDRENIV